MINWQVQIQLRAVDSAAAHTGAAAAALVTMVGRVTIGKKKYAAVEPQMFAMIEKSESLRKILTSAVDEDAASFEGIIAAMRLPKDSPEEIETRLQAVDAATRNAALVPHKVAGLCLEVMDLAVTASQLGNMNAISDAASAGFLAQAALRCAIANVKINTKSLQNPQEMQDVISDTESLERDAEEKMAAIRKNLVERAGF